MCKVYTGYCGTSEIEHSLAPVRSIIPSLKLGDYLSVQTHKPCSISHLFYIIVIGLSFCDSHTISGVYIYCEILSFYIFIWCRQPFVDKFKQKKISLVFRTYEYLKRCTQINFVRRLAYITLKTTYIVGLVNAKLLPYYAEKE